jgi:catechol 2,3-dioxygenase-like lactoylglutathione lyase family enzyme
VFDHVTLRVADLAGSKRFYDLALETLDFSGTPYADEHGVEWNDFAMYEGEPLTRRLHVAFAAPSRGHVDAFWRALVDAGFRDDGAPGPRPQYTPDYYGAFVLDPDGNSAEAVHGGDPRKVGGEIDHLWLRVRSVEETERFYATIAPLLDFELREGSPEGMVGLRVPDDVASCSFVSGDEPTENVHIAFPAPDRATVDEFHRAAVAAGYRDNGAPGERPQYHPGYYGAFVLDPDGNNVEAVFHDRH